MMNIMKRFVNEEEGQTMVEYGLLVALISIVAIAMITSVGANLQTLFTNVAGNL